ncbi:MAG: hypothetical protein EHM55_15320 [Acidobacteria bacterium]|nr:MAG: hypothetical protein EHM55_15320 [Acidobacteriota bacterium]
MTANEKPGVPIGAAERDVLLAVGRAAELARSIQRHAPLRHVKNDMTPLTVADLAAQAIIASALERAFPDVPLVAEEDASPLDGDDGRRLAAETLTLARSSLPDLTHRDLVRLLNSGRGSRADRCWALDPVDGTEGFLRGGHYVVSLALLEGHQPTLAMLACPTLGRTGVDVATEGLVMIARRGGGTWITPMGSLDYQRVHVSDVYALGDARVLRSFVDSHIDVDRTNRVLQTARVGRSPILMDSQAKHMAIAAGRADLFVRIPAGDYREYIWDHAAGALAIEEAGGCVTDLEGRPLDFQTGRRLERNRGLVAANRHLHPLILDVLRRCDR